MKTKVIPLSKLCKIQGRVGWKGYTVDDLRDSGPLVIGANDIDSNHQLDLKEVKHISREKYEESPEIMIENYDILIVKVGSTIGKVAIVNEDIGEACINPNTVLLKNCTINPYFIYYTLVSSYGQSFLLNNSSASAQPALNQTTLKEMPIHIPQDELLINNLTESLNRINSKIKLNNKINRELEAMAKTLCDYWFVQFDFPNADGKPYKSTGGKMVYNAELKREIPEGWEVKKLGDIIKKYADKSTHIESKNILNEGSYPVITQDNGDLISGFTNENNPIEDVPLIVFGDHSCTLRYIDFPFFRGADGTQIMYFEEDLTIYVYLFLQMVITQIPGYGKYERHYKYLKDFNIIIPKAKFLSEFQKIAEPIFNKISKSRLQNQHLTALRDWLLPMLMNGQVTVKEAEERLNMAAEPSVKYGN